MNDWTYWKVRDDDHGAIQAVLDMGAEPFAVAVDNEGTLFIYFKRLTNRPS